MSRRQSILLDVSAYDEQSTMIVASRAIRSISTPSTSEHRAGAPGTCRCRMCSQADGLDCGVLAAAAGRKGEPKAAGEPFRIELFVRRYSVDTRPWNTFHADSAAVTVNVVAL